MGEKKSQFWLGAGLIGGTLLSIFSESFLICSGVLLSPLLLIEYSSIDSPSFFGGGGLWDSFFSLIFTSNYSILVRESWSFVKQMVKYVEFGGAWLSGKQSLAAQMR